MPAAARVLRRTAVLPRAGRDLPQRGGGALRGQVPQPAQRIASHIREEINSSLNISVNSVKRKGCAQGGDGGQLPGMSITWVELTLISVFHHLDQLSQISIFPSQMRQTVECTKTKVNPTQVTDHQPYPVVPRCSGKTVPVSNKLEVKLKEKSIFCTLVLL